MRGTLAGLVTLLASTSIAALLAALKAMRATPPVPFDLAAALSAVLHPATTGDGVRIATLLVLGVIGGVFTAAVAAAHRARPLTLDPPPLESSGS